MIVRCHPPYNIWEAKAPKWEKIAKICNYFLIRNHFCKVWFTKWGCSSLGLRQLQPSCECLVLTLKSKVQSYEAQAMVFVNADEVFSTRCWRTSISSEPYQKCRSILNFCVNPFAVLWNRWSLHFRECVFARACHVRALQRFLSFCFHNLHQTPQSFPQKGKKNLPISESRFLSLFAICSLYSWIICEPCS